MVLTKEEVVLPSIFIWKLDPRTHRMEVINNYSRAFSVAHNVVVTRYEVKADVVLLAGIREILSAGT